MKPSFPSNTPIKKWCIPAKTFLVGEYAATAGGAAMILTTSPCFELEVRPFDSRDQRASHPYQPLQAQPLVEHSATGFSEPEGLTTGSLHPASPAARWAQQYLPHYHLIWRDPYQGIGGLGASSAQFLGAYLAWIYYTQEMHPPILTKLTLLDAYYGFAWDGTGIRPSGYDVLAQSQFGCVYIHREKKHLTSYEWPFEDLAFFLVHTGQKQATHEHLKTITLSCHEKIELSSIAEQARIAFEQTNSRQLVEAVKAYEKKLEALRLRTTHTSALIKHYESIPEILAVKGCGALGADVILLLGPKASSIHIKNQLLAENRIVLASSEDLYEKKALISCNLSIIW